MSGTETGADRPSTLNFYCRECDTLSESHHRDGDQWVCSECGTVKTCSSPDWSDNCNGSLATVHEVRKGLCSGCLGVIKSWSNGDGDGNNDDTAATTEQTTLLPDGGVRETHLSESGLFIPDDLREFTGQVVFRTPRVTIQHFGTQPLDAYYGLIDENDIGPVGGFTDPKNPSLAPNRVSIKRQGEDPVEFVVRTDPEVWCDGGTERSDGAEPTPADEWTVLSVKRDCLTQTAKRRFMEEAADGRGGWYEEEARYHIYKAHDQLSVASYHSRQGGHDAGELVKVNLADALNHMLMAMATTDVDLGECQPVRSAEDIDIKTDGGGEYWFWCSGCDLEFSDPYAETSDGTLYGQCPDCEATIERRMKTGANR